MYFRIFPTNYKIGKKVHELWDSRQFLRKSIFPQLHLMWHIEMYITIRGLSLMFHQKMSLRGSLSDAIS